MSAKFRLSAFAIALALLALPLACDTRGSSNTGDDDDDSYYPLAELG